MLKLRFFQLYYKSGQSLLEVILAMAIFSLILVAMIAMSLGGIVALEQGGEHTQAEALAQEGFEAVRAIRDGAWNKLTYTTSSVSISGNEWVFDGEGLTQTIGQYTRTISFEDVCRDVSNDITTCPGSYTDLHSKKVIVKVDWEIRPGVTNFVQKVAYLTNWDSREWTQTDWVGGSGQSIWLNDDEYESSSGIDSGSIVGQIVLATAADGVWSLGGGETFTDTSDTDFNAGSPITTSIIGMDDDVSVILVTTTVWSVHVDSESATTEDLNDVSFISSTDGWSVGDSGKILNYNGTNWFEDTDIGDTNLNGIEMIALNDGWAVGDNGEVYNYNGSWTQFTGQTFIDTSDTDFRAGTFSSVTTTGFSTNTSIILDQGGVVWGAHTDSSSATTDDMKAITIVSSNNIWAVGKNGKVIHYDGSNWEESVVPSANEIKSISAISASDVWAVGKNGDVWYYNGSSWSSESSSTEEDLRGVYMVATDDVWAVAKKGEIIHYDGTSWSDSTDTGEENWNAVFAISANDIWAVANNGGLAHYNGSSWYESSAPNNNELKSVYGIASNDVWAVGKAGEIIHYNGSSWISISSPTSEELRGVYMIATDDVWATGKNGKILHYDGTNWSIHTDTGNINWNGIAMVSDSSGWIVGQGGVIYELTSSYVSSGTFESQVFDGGVGANWSTVSWTEILPVGADITIATRLGDTATPDGSWSSWSSELTTSAGSIISGDSRYIQYRATFTRATNPAQTPELADITILYDDITNTEDINAIDSTASNDVWAVGDNGIILHYNGSVWSETAVPSSEDIFAVSAISSSNVWVAGKSGRIWNYNGSAWSLDEDTGNEEWYAIAVLTSNDIWLLGKDGKMAHYDGLTWTESTLVSVDDIFFAYVISSTDVWAGAKDGSIIHYDGVSWTEHTNTGEEQWYGIEMLGPTSGFVVGKDGKIWEYTSDVYADTGIFESRIFDGGVNPNWNTLYWTEVLSTDSDITVATRSGNTATPDGTWSSWSGELTDETGSDITSGNAQYLQYRLTFTVGSTTTPQFDDITIIYNAPTGQDLTAISAFSTSSIWAVGKNGTIIHYDGSMWTAIDSPTVEELRGVYMRTATDGWASAKKGEILHYNGSSWTVSTDTGDDNDWNDIFAIASNDVWAVGKGGDVAHYDGSVWTESSGPGIQELRGVYAIASNDVWAVGKQGNIIHYNGSDWSLVSSPTSEEINGVYMVSSTEGWAVGKKGKILKYNGTSWGIYTDTGDEEWRGLGFFDDSDGWAVGEEGNIRRWSGKNWSSFISPTTNDLEGVAMTSLSEGWAVGKNGTIIHFSRDALYQTSGSVTSSAYNMGDSSPVQFIDWDEILPSGADIKFQVRSAPDLGGFPGIWTNWYGSNGSGTYFTSPSSTLISKDLNGNQWMQYRVELTGDGMSTPVLEEVRINYK